MESEELYYHKISDLHPNDITPNLYSSADELYLAPKKDEECGAVAGEGQAFINAGTTHGDPTKPNRCKQQYVYAVLFLMCIVSIGGVVASIFLWNKVSELKQEVQGLSDKNCENDFHATSTTQPPDILMTDKYVNSTKEVCPDRLHFYNNICYNLTELINDQCPTGLVRFGGNCLPPLLIDTQCNACPSEWQNWNGKCYRYFYERMYWQDAEDHCGKFSNSSHLVSIHSADEQDFVYYSWRKARDPSTVITSWGPKLHLGLHDISSEGIFNWTDGTPVDYTNWLSGQPNNQMDQDIASIYDGYANGRGQWGDDSILRERNTFFCKSKPICYVIASLIPFQ